MESWPGQEKRVQMVLTGTLAETTGELAFEVTQPFELAAKRMQQEQPLKASQPAGPLQVSEDRREPEKWPGLEIAPAV
jgi:hypothetical protein